MFARSPPTFDQDRASFSDVSTLVVHSHPLEDSYSAAIRDAVCAALDTSGVGFRVVDFGEGSEPDPSREFDHLVAIYPTWWGGPPAVMLDWLRSALGDHVDGDARAETSPFASVRRITVVTTHGSSALLNKMQAQPGKLTWSRVVIPQCAPGAEFEWLSLYAIDTTTEAERTGFIDRVSAHFTSATVPA